MRTVIISLLLGASVIAHAQEWTYADCVEYAYNNNISLRQSMLSESTSDLSYEESKAQWQPSLDFSTSHGFTNSPWGENNKNAYNSSYGFNAGWTVWNGGQREAGIKKNRILGEVARMNTIALFRSLETDILSAYLNILYSREAISIYEEAVNLSYAQSERARQLMEAGKLSKVDYAQLRSQYEQDKYSLVNAQGTYDSRVMEMKRLLELGITDSLSLREIDWANTDLLAPAPSIEESYVMATDVDSQLKSLRLSQDAADADIDIARASGYPSISLNAGVGSGYFTPGNSFGEQMKRSFNENIGLTLSIPILDNKRTKVAVAKAKVQKLNSQLDIESRQTQLAQDVESWYIQLKSAQAQYVAGEEQVASTSLSNELVNEQFNLGLVNIVELMTAHNNLLQARHSLLQTKYMALLSRKMIEFYRTADITLPQ